ncbi:hypothetical protein CPJ18_05040 [Agrobacterium rosae]|uniref:Uncharacterized protein n=1 Tax=Agrobacterium rosae TaxID=1972867 RepID=A0AAE5S0S6_9HYPH|nr:hypothetical protein CPJ18_05040 [Agrobacterium rosae]
MNSSDQLLKPSSVELFLFYFSMTRKRRFCGKSLPRATLPQKSSIQLHNIVLADASAVLRKF